MIGGGNTAMDCCRTALRLGAEDVKVTVRSPRKDMKASDWEIEEAELEGIPIYDNHNPKAFVLENGKLVGVLFESHAGRIRRRRPAQADPDRRRGHVPSATTC